MCKISLYYKDPCLRFILATVGNLFPGYVSAQSTEDGTNQSGDMDDTKAKRQKLPLHLNKERRTCCWFNNTVTDADIEEHLKNYIPKNTCHRILLVVHIFT